MKNLAYKNLEWTDIFSKGFAGRANRNRQQLPGARRPDSGAASHIRAASYSEDDGST
jgi:hypothetical protein